MKKNLLGALLVLLFLAYALPPYLTGGSRIPLENQPSWYYWLLVGHIMLGAVAMVAGLIQLGRRWRPLRRLHRYSGRVFVACMIPVSLMSIAIGTVSPFGPVVALSDVLLGSLTLASVVLGFRAILGGDVAEHRKWMVRGSALMYSIIVNRVIGPFVFLACDAITGHQEELTNRMAMSVTAWLSWTSTLLIVELVRRRRATPRRPLHPAAHDGWAGPGERSNKLAA